MTKSPVVMRSFLEQLPVGVILLDKSLGFLFCNEKALEWLRIPIENLMGGTFLECLSSPTLEKAIEEFKERNSDSESIQLAIGAKHLTITLSRMRTEEGETILILLDDITRYKSLDNIKDDFITVLLHKLRNPLTSVKTALSLLAVDPGKEMPEKQKALYQLSLKEVDRLNALLSQLRNVFSVETGLIAKELEIEKIDIEPVVNKAVNDKFKNRVKIDCKQLKVLADFEKLKETLSHLISNALLYSDDIVTVSAHENKGVVHIEIADRGIGISERDAYKVYDKYFRGEEATKRNPEGEGIGLYLARAFLGHFDGSIYFDSQLGKGTTFFITLQGEK